jgi:hypothetical protein
MVLWQFSNRRMRRSERRTPIIPGGHFEAASDVPDQPRERDSELESVNSGTLQCQQPFSSPQRIRRDNHNKADDPQSLAHE